MDVYREIRRLQLEGVTSQRAAAKRLGISRNTIKKYWEGNVVPWEHRAYSRAAGVKHNRRNTLGGSRLAAALFKDAR